MVFTICGLSAQVMTRHDLKGVSHSSAEEACHRTAPLISTCVSQVLAQTIYAFARIMQFGEKKGLHKVGEVLKGLRSNGLREFLEDSSVLSDKLSQSLIKKIGRPHSPMSVMDLPIDGFPRDVALVRLYDLERMGILKSELARKKQDYVRVFHITPVGKKIAQVVRAKS